MWNCRKSQATPAQEPLRIGAALGQRRAKDGPAQPRDHILVVPAYAHSRLGPSRAALGPRARRTTVPTGSVAGLLVGEAKAGDRPVELPGIPHIQESCAGNRANQVRAAHVILRLEH